MKAHVTGQRLSISTKFYSVYAFFHDRYYTFYLIVTFS